MSIYYRGLFAKNADILNELAAASGYKLVTDQENGEFWLEADAEASETMMIDNPAEWPLAVLQFSRMVERERAAAELLRLSQAIASAIHFLKSGIIANEDRVAEVRSLQRAISPFKGLVAQLQDDSLWT